ncbi:MAG: ABC transporter ATP-binding protein [Gammaproteobacteria bacterium]|nr:ABC transporter ATP-binding protein [Gammaproteobacteria bacterium]
MSRTIVELENISFSYMEENSQVLKTLSLKLNTGEIISILGPNGIGKTTMLHIILGWIKVRSGSVFLKGRNSVEFSRKEMGQLIGLVPQYEHISFEYSLLEYVLLGRAPHLHSLQSPGKNDYIIALNSLKRVGMENQADRSVLHLSGGEKQLLLLARSLAQEPEILLLDEPMSNLDLANKIKIIKILQSLKKEGVTIIYTSHEPEIAADLSDYLVLMGQDFSIEQGITHNVLTSENLSRIYNIPVKIKEIDGRKIVLWH